MTNSDYNNLVVQWQPGPERDRTYRVIIVLCLAVVLAVGLTLSLAELPERERTRPEDIPERVARFMAEQPPRPEPAEPEPQPEPRPLPVVEPRPVVERERPEPETREPLTEAERDARETAEQSGLLALGEQLDGLMDTSDVDAMVDTRATGRSEDAQAEAGFGDTDVLTSTERAEATGGGTVSISAGDTQLSRREVARLSRPEEDADDPETRAARRATFEETGRSEEEVSLVFDQNKGALYSLYNRARRQTPGLEGRLVVEVTIAPSGEVTEVDIVSSELDDPSLEARIRARVLQFQFEAREADTITIIYPIEFLPS